MKKFNLEKISIMLKRNLKNKVSISGAIIIAIMIAGFFGLSNIAYGSWLAINEGTGAVGVEKSGASNGEYNKVYNVILSKWDAIKDRGVEKTKNSVVIGAGNGIKGLGDGVVVIGVDAKGNNDITTAIGYGTQATGRGSTAIGASAKTYGEGQATAVGVNTYANGQSVAIGNDVYATGRSSIAIGNDDIKSVYTDKLPLKTIELIFKDKNKSTAMDNAMNWNEFQEKYSIKSSNDNRIYSPTYSKGNGAISIGSRSIAYGQGSLSIGTLSFALANESTAVGIRAFVDNEAEGGVAIGDESRVFAANSFAIGNRAESTSKGSLSFGSNAKAVGIGSIAIGPSVSSNAELVGPGDEEFAKIIMKHTSTANPNVVDNGISADITYNTNEELKFGNESFVVQSGFALHLPENRITKIIDEVIKEKENKISYSYDETKEKLETNKKIYPVKKAGDHAISLGYYISNNGNNTIAIGSASIVRGSNSLVLGALNNIGKYATNTIALGIGTNVFKENSIAIGTGVNVTGAGAIAIGSGVGVTKDNTISIGYGSHGLSKESIVLGNDASLKENTAKSIVIGNSAKVENKKSTTRQGDSNNTDFSAVAIGTSSNVMAQNSVGLGNKSEVSMENSVALGYRSTTKYFYANENKNRATLTGQDAINLPGYVPEGSTYIVEIDGTAGIVSVGGWDNKGQVGFRRIVNVAPGALDSDVATIGQLKALQYTKKEGVVTYYTEENGKIYKVTKDTNGNFYKVNTENGAPLDDVVINKDKVFAGPKGYNEQTVEINSRKTANMGEVIKFGHIADGEIKDKSDQAITGNQINDLIGILGIENKKTDMTKVDYTKLDKKNFEAVEYVNDSNKAVKSTHREAIADLISAVNSGYVFSDGTTSKGKDIPSKFYLGSKVEIKAGDIPKQSSENQANTPQYLGKNLKTKLSTNDKKSEAIFEIGFSDTPTFKNIQVTEDIPESDKDSKYVNYVVNKKYLDKRLSNVAANFDVKGDNFNDKDNKTKYTLDKSNTELNIKGKTDSSNDNHKNITTSVSKDDKSVTIELNENLKGIASIENDEKTKITLSGDKSIKFSSGDTPSVVTLTGSKLSGLTEINKEDSKASLKFGDNKIELITENDKKVTLEKDLTNDGVQVTGLTTIGKDIDNALVFDKKENGTDKATLKIGISSLTFTKDNSSIKLSGLADGKIEGSSTEAITGKQLHELSVSRLGLEVDDTDSKNIKFKELSFDSIKGSGKTEKIKTFKGAIEGLIGAVNKGITFKGTDSSKTTTLQLGETLTINGEDTNVGKKEGETNKTEKDINVEVTPNDKDPKNERTITLKLNKSASVDENDDRAIKSSAVANELKKYTTTETLEEDFLKVSGVNVLDISEFGKNIGISEIKLDKNEKSSTELLQAKALIEYLKGSGEKSVKLSDSNNTISSGEGSISIGYDAKAKNEGAISIGYNSEASNAGSISIGQDSNVIGVNSIGIGKENDVKSNFTFVIGDENKLGINSNESYVIGSNNEISGRKNISIGSRNNVEGNENILLGSNIVADESINNAVVLGNNSQAVDGAVSVGSFNNRRRISFVGDPLQDYDATNKKYVDERGIKFKGNVNTSTEKLVKLDKILTIDSSSSNKGTKLTEKDINTKVEADNTNGAKLTLELNKATTLDENDERVITSKAVYTKYKELDEKITDTKIKYRANSSNEIKEVKLSKGLDFLKDDNSNISVTVEDSGKIKHSLANNLKEITSILGGSDEKAAKIILSNSKTNDKSITLNDAKLTGILDGKIESSSKDAISGNQLNDLVTKLGIAINEKDNTKFDDPSFEDIKNGADTTTADSSTTDKKIKTYKDAIDKLIEAVNKGYEYSADENDKVNTDKLHYLGSTININRLADSTTTSDTTPTITMSEFTGKNLVTQYKYEDGNAKIEIGFKNAPTFEKVSLSSEQEYSKKDSIGNNDLITKKYLEEALNSFKIKVKANGGKDIELGRGDTLNLENGLNIEVDLKKGSADSTNKATTSTPSTTVQPTSTTAVATIGTTKELTGLIKVQTEKDEDGVSSVLDTESLTISDDKNLTTVDIQGVIIQEDTLTNEQTAESNTLTNEEGQTVVKAGEISINDSTGANKVRIDDKSITFTENSGKITGLQDANLDENSTEAVNGGQLVKATGAKIIEDTTGTKKMVFSDGKDGKSGIEVDSMANKGLTSKDGLNGKNANDKANALRNGEAGVVIYTDKDGNRLVKAKDGKYYKADEILEADGRLKDIAGLTPVDKPTLSLVNTDGTTNTPVQLSNVASGLNVEDKVKDAVITKEDATKAVSDTLLTKKGKELQKATNLADLQALAVAGFNYKGDTGETIHKNLGETLDIVGANSNVSVDSKDNKLQITLNDKLTNMKSIDFKEGVITGLKDLNDTDPGHYAVNKNYVDNKFGIAKQGIDKALSGVANAVAMANITQVSGNSGYRHQIGASYGNYGKEHALAVGVSGVSKGGQVLYKVSGSLNNRGNFAAGIGIGYQFDKKEDKADENAKKMNDMMNKIKELEKIVKESKNEKYETKLYTINQFRFDSTELTRTQIIKLKDIVKEINEKYSDRTIDITGFADITGKEGYNLDLGLDRANKVVDLMVEFGLKNPRNIRKVSSFGYNNKVSKSTDQNRRVEIEIK